MCSFVTSGKTTEQFHRIHHNFSLKDLEVLIYLLTITNRVEEELIPLTPWILEIKSIPGLSSSQSASCDSCNRMFACRHGDISAKSKGEREKRSLVSHKQVRRENEHNINMLLVDMSWVCTLTKVLPTHSYSITVLWGRCHYPILDMRSDLAS